MPLPRQLQQQQQQQQPKSQTGIAFLQRNELIKAVDEPRAKKTRFHIRRNNHNGLIRRTEIDWHKDLANASQTGQWDRVRDTLELCSMQKEQQLQSSNNNIQSRGGFWNRKKKRQTASDGDSSHLHRVDDQGRTPLYAALSCKNKQTNLPSCPVDVLLRLVELEPLAVQIPNDRQRLPLHIAVLYKHDFDVVSRLVDAYPAALSLLDVKGQSPLAYAVDIAKAETDLREAPKSFWMPSEDDAVLDWQEEQTERWAIVHWLLLSAATYPEARLDVGEGSTKPMLVEALLFAAPPSIVSLLIGASVALLTSVKNRASAFAGSTLYSCIARHYPLRILLSLTAQCPLDVRNVRDETGMGLVSAQFVLGCFQQEYSTQEWNVQTHFYSLLNQSIQNQALIEEDPAFLDWWNKIENLIAFCGGNTERGRSNINKDYLLHAALRNPDVPPIVVRLLVALYPESIWLPLPTDATPLTNATTTGIIGAMTTATASPTSSTETWAGFLPIHLAAQSPEYIPRNYEFQIMSGETTSCGLLLQMDSELARVREPSTSRRLPLHMAIAAGKTFKSLEFFLNSGNDENDVEHDNDNNANTTTTTSFSCLEQRDPESGLYPFQQAASYTIVTTQDGYRWSCIARNKYSHAVWKGLRDRQKATAILRVAEAEDLSRLDTIYQLLRNKPGVLRPAGSKETMALFRNECGMGMVASHYLSYCYGPSTTNNNTGDWEVHSKQYNIFQTALSDAKESGLLLRSAPLAFLKWWQKMKFWIRYCEPPKSNDWAHPVRAALPKKDAGERYLLHAALTNPDTPPQVVEVILALHPETAKIPILNSMLPLHIAASSTCYTPRFFEQPVEKSTLELTLNAYPGAAFCRICKQDVNENDDNIEYGRLPLHLAIASERTWVELRHLVAAEPLALRSRDPETKLYPFLLMSQKCTYARAEQQLHLQYVARNKFAESEWRQLTPRQRAKEMQQVRKERKLERLSTAFELLRRDVSVIEMYSLARQKETDAFRRTPCTSNASILAAANTLGNGTTVATQDESFEEEASESEESEVWDSDGSESEAESITDTGFDASFALEEEDNDVSTEMRQASPPQKSQRPSLTSFFTREAEHPESEHQQGELDVLQCDVFECDASVLSGVDVMSLVSGTGHSRMPRRSRRPGHNIEVEEKSVNLSVLFGGDGSADSSSSSSDEESSSGEFAAESSEEAADDSPECEDSGLLIVESDDDEDETDGSDDDLVFFEMRRQWKKNTCGQQAQEYEPMRQLRLSKKDDEKSLPRRAKSSPLYMMSPLKKDSLRNMLMSSRGIRNRAHSGRRLSASVHSSSSDSYISLRMEYLNKSSSDMLWVGDKYYESGLLGSAHSSKYSSEADLYASYGSFRKAASGRRKKSSDASMSSSSQLKNSGSRSSSASCSDGSDASNNMEILESELENDSHLSPAASPLTANYSTFAHDANEEETPGNTSNSTRNQGQQSNGAHVLLVAGLGDEGSEDSEPDLLGANNASAEERHESSAMSSGAPTRSLGDYFRDSRDTSQSSRATEPSALPVKQVAEVVWLDDPRDEKCPHDGVESSGSLLNQKEPFQDEDDQPLGVGPQGTDAVKEEKTKEQAPVVSETYFDKVEMRWIKRTAVPRATEVAMVGFPKIPLTEEKSEAHAPSQEPPLQSETYFDKVEMKWKKRTLAPRPAEVVTNKTTALSKLVSPPTSPSPTTESDGTHPFKINADNLLSTLSSPLKSITEDRQLSPLLPPKQSLKKMLSPSKNGSPFDNALSREKTKRKNTALFESFEAGAKGSHEKEIPCKSPSSSPRSSERTWTRSPSADPKNVTCLLCDKNHRHVLLVPCRHLALCRCCSSKRTDVSACPLCNETITDRLLLF